MYSTFAPGARWLVATVAIGVFETLLPAQQPDTPSARQQALERALQDLDEGGQKAAAPPAAPAPVAAGVFRPIDVSLDIVLGLGTSTARDAALEDLQGGGHDPKKRGITLEQAELSLGGAVDPYFTAESHLVFFLDPAAGETNVELEEAFVTTQALPWDLQVKAGLFLTEFGRLNAVHPHAWAWQDQPIILTRVFGGDGMRAPGARLSWLVPTPNYTEVLLAAQNANGEQMTSFLASEAAYEERPVGGRAFAPRSVRSLGDVVWSARLQTGFDLDDASSAAFGVSAALGPNATGDGARTLIYGADFVYKWQPTTGQRGWPYLRVQGEVVGRSFEAAAQVDDSDPTDPVPVPGTTLRDFGGYLQASWGFVLGWDVGLRAEWASGAHASYDRTAQTLSRASDPYRADRVRLSPMCAYHPSEFSRIRLQYDYDDTDALPHPVHSVWLGLEMLIGKHPPHKY